MLHDVRHLVVSRCICTIDCFVSSLQTWDPWNVPLALSCAVRVFRLLSQVTLLRCALFFTLIPYHLCLCITLR